MSGDLRRLGFADIDFPGAQSWILSLESGLDLIPVERLLLGQRADRQQSQHQERRITRSGEPRSGSLE